MEKKMYQVTENDYVTLNEICDYVLDNLDETTESFIEALHNSFFISLNAFYVSSEEVDDALLDKRRAFIIAYMCEMYKLYEHHLKTEEYEIAQAYLYMWDRISLYLGDEKHFIYWHDNINCITEVN